MWPADGQRTGLLFVNLCPRLYIDGGHSQKMQRLRKLQTDNPTSRIVRSLFQAIYIFLNYHNIYIYATAVVMD